MSGAALPTGLGQFMYLSWKIVWKKPQLLQVAQLPMLVSRQVNIILASQTILGFFRTILCPETNSLCFKVEAINLYVH